LSIASDDRIEAASQDQIAALQLQRLRLTVAQCYASVPHYRAAFDAAGVHPDDVKSLDDLRRLPFTQKSDLRRNAPFGMFAVPRDQVLRLHASSGSTGTPSVVGYTAQDLDLWARLTARHFRNCGTRPGDVVHIALGYGMFTGGFGFHAGAERLGCTVVPASGGMTARQVRLIEDFGATTICATPSYMLVILDEYRAQGRDPRQSALRIGLFGGEPWSEAMRAEIEAGFNMQALDCYGLSEVIGPGVATEDAETKDGMHIWEDHFIAEVIDPATGSVLPDGEMGELVLTSLSKQASPAIRYRTGDLTRLLPPSTLPVRRMSRVLGRSDDMIILRGVNLFPSQIEAQVLAQAGLTGHFQIELTRAGRMDQLTLRVEAAAGDGAGLAEALMRRIKQALGVTVQVKVGVPGSVPRSEGKAVRVIDHRPNV
jgi:phenylacetate-CoA ligase